MSLREVRNLSVDLPTAAGRIGPVNDVSFQLAPAESLRRRGNCIRFSNLSRKLTHDPEFSSDIVLSWGVRLRWPAPIRVVDEILLVFDRNGG